jgi:hypothetical protein
MRLASPKRERYDVLCHQSSGRCHMRSSARVAVLLLLIPLPSGASRAEGAGSAPTTLEEVRARVEQLRSGYRPYLRSLPKAPDVRARPELGGTWRSRFELAQAADSVRPSPPDWWRVDLDDSDWQEVTVPEWRYGMETGKEKRPVSCILWYRTVFEGARPPSGRRVFLVFGGVDWEAEVWLNGTFLGRHKGHCEAFRFESFCNKEQPGSACCACCAWRAPNHGQFSYTPSHWPRSWLAAGFSARLSRGLSG